MPNIGPTELIIILVIVVLLFGVGKITDVGGALGKGVREFRQASKELEGAAEDIKKPLAPGKKSAPPPKETESEPEVEPVAAVQESAEAQGVSTAVAETAAAEPAEAQAVETTAEESGKDQQADEA